MQITYDPVKRTAKLAKHGLDFETRPRCFAGLTLTLLDGRLDYREDRYQTYGLLGDRLVMVVWTPRGEDRHIISMRKCNEREKARFENRLAR